MAGSGTDLLRSLPFEVLADGHVAYMSTMLTYPIGETGGCNTSKAETLAPGSIVRGCCSLSVDS